MGYNRPEAKALAKQAMRTTYPHPMLVTLVYVLLASVLTNMVSKLVTNPFGAFYLYVLDRSYDIEDLIRVLLVPRTVAAFLVIQLLITVYQWIMSFGYTSYVLRMARNEQPNCWNLLDGFRTIGRAFLVYLLIYIFTTLWSLLFLVPAFIVMLVSALGGPMLMFLALLLVIAGAILSVIVTYRYRLAVYFLLDNPEMGALAAITESKRLKESSGLDARPVYEKHKIFLYREDMERFMSAFQAATAYVHEHAAALAASRPADSYTAFVTEGQEPVKDTETDEDDMGNSNTFGKSATDFRIDFDF